jgi:acyl transferase domain-containing protein
MGSYFYFNLCSNRDLVESTGMFLLRHTGNDKDFLSTRVSHVFDLKGPSLNVQTACSTSLVAIHMARSRRC